MTVTLSPRRWTGVFSPRKKFRTPRTPLDTVDSLDNQKFNQIFNVATPRPGRKVCDHCGVEAASARLHCVRGTSRMEDESNDYHISLCDRCMKKEDKGELKSQLRTARHNIMDKRVSHSLFLFLNSNMSQTKLYYNFSFQLNIDLLVDTSTY